MCCRLSRPAAVPLLALALLLSAPAAPARDELSDDLRRFREDEVRYLITDGERAKWDSLETNAERLEFVKHFWARRDPDPSTPVNEYREEHHRRVIASNQLFRGEGKAGWLTDRGRVYIIFGPPDEVLDEPPGTVDEGPTTYLGQSGGFATPRTTSAGRITFTYRKPDNPFLGPNTRIVFERQPSGRYILASDVNPSAESAYFSSTLGRTTRDDSIQKPKTQEDIKTEPLGMKDTYVFAQLLRGERPPEVAELPMEVSWFPVGQPQLYAPLRFERTWSTPGPTETLRVRLAADREGNLVIYSLDLTLTPEGSATRSLGFMLDPGDYLLGLACEDGNGRVVAASTQSLKIPDLDGSQLATSSVLLARNAETRPSGLVDMEALQDGLMLGNYALDAPLGNVLQHEAPAPLVIFLVNGGAANAEGGLDLMLHYAVMRDGDKVWELERPQKRAFVGHSLPVSHLPAADYILELTVVDLIANQSVTESVPFRIE